MAPMGIRLSPLGIGVFCLLGVGVLYHLYTGSLSSRVTAFLLGERAPAAAPSAVDLRELLAVSLLAAARGGVEVKRVRESNALNEKVKSKTREGADERMTLGDQLSNRQMYYLIRNAFPSLQINTEEQLDPDSQEPISWDRSIPTQISELVPQQLEVPAESITIWIDPLDATQEYTENLRQYVTTMVCVAVDGNPVIGVIHKPFSGFTAWGMVNVGSNVKARDNYSKTPKLIVSRSHAGKVKEVALKTFGNDTEIIPAGGAGYKVLSLLEVTDDNQEQADVYIHTSYIKKWDICAGNALLRSLGGHMTTLRGEEIIYTGSDGNEGGLLASIGVDHIALVQKLSDKFPDLDKSSHK
ncbi:Golgi-resident adenosine 3',5'-bisphosphate 3'-phosphatase [Microcaecilia unicolor]|uniref:Inositol monophosphatase 3 n=1 Tax=Microcaecilia unicolor TaxID=1415580 RepID=A0A6P7YTK2_9AMPH|nr:inositol monophosphatase 3 [Microcaecilia unicolor]